MLDKLYHELVDEVITSETTMPSIPDIVLDTINDVIVEGDSSSSGANEPPPDYDQDAPKTRGAQLSPKKHVVTSEKQNGGAAATKKTSSETQEVHVILGEDQSETSTDTTPPRGNKPTTTPSSSSSHQKQTPKTPQPTSPTSPTTPTQRPFTVNGQVLPEQRNGGVVGPAGDADRKGSGDQGVLSTPVPVHQGSYKKRTENVQLRKKSEDDGNATISRQVGYGHF